MPDRRVVPEAQGVSGEAPAPSSEPTYEELVRALRWYAERRNYVPAAPPAVAPPKHLMATDAFDGEGPGARARAALAGDGGGA